MTGIRLENVTKRFGATVAVDSASLEIRKGELFFLLGPSGCGKTTILRMLAGFAEPDAGEIYFGDRPMSRVAANRRNTGMVFQNYALWPHLSVAANVAYGLEERRVPAAERRDRVGRALAAVRMEEYAERQPNQLSGGQQQRVALARALVIEPEVVLLDEPLSNLDARLRLDMRTEIRRIHDTTGITMVYVTHDQKEALSMADRIAVMSMGRVEQLGTPRDVYRRPASHFVAEFIGEANSLQATVRGSADGMAELDTEIGGIRVQLPAHGSQWRPGAAAVCMIRPECWRQGAAAENSFTATLQSASYLGEFEELVFAIGGREIKMLQANPGAEPARPGLTMPVHFAPADAVILPR